MTREEKLNYDRMWRKICRDVGLCTMCKKRQADAGYKTCLACRTKKAVYQGARYKARRAARG